MELYRIIVTCANTGTGSGNPRTLDFIPENFEGIKITQKFSWQNPMGYTPTFSVETMRVIEDDKIWVDEFFDTYGLQCDMTFAIYKLNATATDYTFKSNFKVDFESFLKMDYYSEFALKSDSCIDYYNQTKNSKKDFSGASLLSIPANLKFINYISLKKKDYEVFNDSTALLVLEENENSRIYNTDTALYWSDSNAYEFNRADGTVNIEIIANGSLLVYFTFSGGSENIYVKMYRGTKEGYIYFDDPVITLATKEVLYGPTTSIEIDLKKTKISNYQFYEDDVFYIGVEASSSSIVITDVPGSLSVEMYVSTEIDVNQFGRKISYLTSESILNGIFDNKALVSPDISAIAVTASQTIIKMLNYISLVPKDFLTDFCATVAAMVNFKNDGTVKFHTVAGYFSSVLRKANAIEIDTFKNVEIGYDSSLNFATVSVGMEQKNYDVYTYSNDWNKILTFRQNGRIASENLNLALTKYRTDFSGILDYITKMSRTSTDTSSDVFIFQKALSPRTTSEGTIYDLFTPRDMLERWRTFLEYIFYNYDKDTLVLDSNSGDDSNLQISGVNQFDDFVFSGDKIKILPLKISFTATIDSIDFTEKILKITHNSEDLFIFVTEAETTDKLSEQKIKGNLIYFPQP